MEGLELEMRVNGPQAASRRNPAKYDVLDEQVDWAGALHEQRGELGTVVPNAHFQRTKQQPKRDHREGSDGAGLHGSDQYAGGW